MPNVEIFRFGAFLMKKYFGPILSTLLLFSCTNSDVEKKHFVSKPFETSGITPDAGTMKPARIVQIDTCPAPRITQLSQHIPKTNPAGFYVPMTTYSGEQGLYSAISSILKDRNGNMWFGTYGGGVYRYDGKTFTAFTTAQGMCDNAVLCMAEDKDGNLWFGTETGGACKYDGKSFTTFSTKDGLCGNNVLTIAVDKNGNLWFGTGDGGVSRYAPPKEANEENVFTTFTTKHGLGGNFVSAIAEDKKGNLWFGTKGGVSRYNPDQHTGSSDLLFTTYTTAQGLCHNSICSIAQDKDGNMWFGSDGGGVSRYDGNSFTTYTKANGLCSDIVKSIVEDKSGNLWLGMYSGGVSRHDPQQNLLTEGKPFVSYTIAQGLCNNNVLSMACDKNGNLWVGTFGGGASRYDGKSFMTYTRDQGLSNNIIFNVAESKSGDLWFATYGSGVSRYTYPKDGKEAMFTNYSAKEGVGSNSVYCLAEDKNGNLWFGTETGGLSCFNGKSIMTYNVAQGLAGSTVYCMAMDKKGDLWLGTDGGASKFDGKSFTTFTTDQGLCNNAVRSIAEDKQGNLWFGTDGGGVSRYTPTGSKPFTTFNSAHGLCHNYIYSILEDKNGNLWLGSNGGGVSRYDGKTFTGYITAHGLSNNSVVSINEDKDGNIWFGTNEGFSVLKQYNNNSGDHKIAQPDNNLPNAGLTENYTPVFEIYNFKNGYPVKDVNTHATLIDSKGILWAGTGDKLVRFDYSGIYKNPEAPVVFINSLKVGGERIGWNDLKRKKIKNKEQKLSRHDSMAIVNEEVSTFGEILSGAVRDSMQRKFSKVTFDSIDRFYPLPRHLTLPFRYNNVTFDFAAVEPAKPYLVKYQYLLEGYDEDWNPVTNKTTATFGNIHEGTYTFKIKAQSPDGVWSVPVEYTFTVLPPMTRTWWAYLIYLSVFGTAVTVFLRWRTSALRNEKANLELIVLERTAQVLNEKKKSDELLLNILPEEVAAELKESGRSVARHYDNVTVIFTDFENFTQVSELMTPQALINELHTCFKTFDEITHKYNIEKIKTIGDAYLAVAGLPVPDPKHAENVINAAKAMSAYMTMRHDLMGNKSFRVRIGIHSGSVVAGIVGVKKFAYDIWGDTVNTAARMEQNSEPGKINISQSTYELVKDKFTCEYRGEIHAKNKGNMKMYFVS